MSKLHIITPREYSSNMRYTLVPDNMIDTVDIEMLDGTVIDNVTHTESIDTVEIGNEEFSLPLSLYYKPTHARSVWNNSSGPLLTKIELAKSRMECIMVEGTRTFTVDQPIKGVPSASLSLQGKSYIIDRGKCTYNDYPSLSVMQNYESTIAPWIYNNSKATRYDTLTNSYDKQSFSMNPWVRKPVQVFLPILPETNFARPTANDILTAWWKDNTFYPYQCEVTGWDGNSTNNLQETLAFYMLPDTTTTDIEKLNSSPIWLQNRYLTMNCSVEKINDYTFKVSWRAPVRVAYCAASQEGYMVTATPKRDVDNYAYLDNVESINIILQGTTYNTDIIHRKRGWDGLSSAVPPQDKSVLNLNTSDCLNSKSYSEDGVLNMPAHIHLTSLAVAAIQRGKHVVTCSVPASWCLDNGITLHSQVKIMTVGGSMLQREKKDIIFEVLNIEKIFKNSTFVFRLKLREV